MKIPGVPTRHLRMGIGAILLLAAAFFLAAARYQACAEGPSRVLAHQQLLSADAAPTPGGSVPDDAGNSTPQAGGGNDEYGVTNTNLYKYAGTMDVENRYASTIMITTNTESKTVLCSGVVIDPRVVLTAASCLCEPGGNAQPPDNAKSSVQGMSCLERASVTTVIYGVPQDKEYPEETTPMRFRSYEGTVRLHPEFMSHLENSGVAKPRYADLAVIVLDKTVKDVPPASIVEQSGFKLQEPLFMSGYADARNSSAVGGLYGIRYFRKNTITQVLVPAEGRVLYQQQGPSIYNGYSGGPCFREDGQQQRLVGIATIGSDMELSFTAISSYGEWLRSEMGNAAHGSVAPEH